MKPAFEKFSVFCFSEISSFLSIWLCRASVITGSLNSESLAMALPVPHSVISIASINLFMSLSSREKCCIALLDADISQFGCRKVKNIFYFDGIEEQGHVINTL